MPKFKGTLITCSRCNTAIFLKHLGKENLDGGHSSYDKYEELPKEWMSETQFGYLCPRCAREFQRFCRDFFPKEVASAWRNALEWEEKYTDEGNKYILEVDV